MALDLNRRALLGGLAGLGGLAALPTFASAKSARIVVIGGGYGGATAARFVKQLAPTTDVTLIEPNKTYVSCPFSNLVIAGERDLQQQQFSYDSLSKAGVTVVHDRAADIDAAGRVVRLESGQTLSYDRLILSPGIDMRWDALDGYSPEAVEAMPHAWKAGAQTELLRRQLEAMEDGGLVVMSVPPAPFRCPPGPYERASLIAHYLKSNKPRSKLLILDAQHSFSKQPLFQAEWSARYPDHLEWHGAADDGRVSRIDATAMQLETDFETFDAVVANVIPPQKAGEIAHRASVADATGWCPINSTSFESSLQPDIHVIGDATIAAPMPKSAFSANLQGKLCAIQVVRLLSDMAAAPTTLVNTCYSYVAPDEAISIVGAYTNNDGVFENIPGAGGLSPAAPQPGDPAREAVQADDWFHAITSETFG